MKKLTLAIFLVLASFSMVSAEIGLKVGFNAQLGEFNTSGFETEGTETSETMKEQGFVGLASYFIEQNLGILPGPFGRISVGYSHVPHDLKSGTSSNSRTDQDTNTVDSPVLNSISADISNYDTLYVSVNIFDWLYVKAGSVDLDVKTTENLETGSQYPNTSLSGDIIGFGVHHQTESGFFGRLEYLDTSIGGTTLTSSTNSDNKVTLKDLEGETLGLSFGKAF
jgi:hypothetical protein